MIVEEGRKPRSILALVGLAALADYTAFQRGGVLPTDQCEYLPALGLGACSGGGAGVLRCEDSGAEGSGVRGPPGAVFRAGALAAILLHSLADFNLYVLANAMLLAWIAGMIAGIRSQPSRTSGWERHGHLKLITVEAVEIGSRR